MVLAADAGIGGSIPACAGEPRNRRRPYYRAKVYPRVCGGTSADILPLLTIDGLSPRVRGNRVGMLRYRTAEGSIPACAGEPLHTGGLGFAGWVYPRVCGGTPAPSCC